MWNTVLCRCARSRRAARREGDRWAALAVHHLSVVQEQVDVGVVHVPVCAGVGIHVDDVVHAIDGLGHLDYDVGPAIESSRPL